MSTNKGQKIACKGQALKIVNTICCVVAFEGNSPYYDGKTYKTRKMIGRAFLPVFYQCMNWVAEREYIVQGECFDNGEESFLVFDFKDAEVIINKPTKDSTVADQNILDENEKPEYVVGGGYSFDLEHFTEDDDVDHAVLQRALGYCKEGKVHYLSIRNGVGTAFVEGTKWYEINFSFENGYVSEMYCECPYAGLCKHNLAILITLNELVKKIEREEFTSLSRGFFIRALTISGQAISF